MPKRLLVSSLSMLMAIMAFGQYQAPKVTLLDHRDRIRIKRLNTLNTEYRETNLSITPDGRFLFFMSMRGGQIWTKSDYMTLGNRPVSDGDIWFSEKRNGVWTSPRCLPFGINTSMGEDEPNISPDGRVVYYQSWQEEWMINGGPYYVATRNGNEWSTVKGLGGGITEFFRLKTATDGMSISPDGRTFIVAAGDDYEGNMDLYISVKDRYGWRYCRRLPISTQKNERSVFIAGDGKTVYFASDGYGGFGGLDIYKTELQADGSIGEVINIGAPFNTPGDDFGFILTANGQEAYFVRNDDIYFADLSEADERIKPGISSNPSIVKGMVRDSLDYHPITADILVIDHQTKRLIRRVKSGSNGRFQVSLPENKRKLDFIVMREGYFKKFKYLQLSSSIKTQNFLLTPLKLPEEELPPLAEAEVFPPSIKETKPEASQIEKIEPEVVDAKPSPSPAPEQPAKVMVKEKKEDPYSFKGVAQNNLILLLDVSASMRKPEKFPLLKKSFAKLLEHMRPQDMISVIVYSGESKIILESVSASQKDYIINSIERIRSSGATKGKAALRKAYRLADDYFISGGNNRIILATDGYFDVADLYSIVERNEEKVSLSVFSFGKLVQSKLDELTKLANLGGGRHTPISAGNIDEALLQEAKAVRSRR